VRDAYAGAPSVNGDAPNERDSPVIGSPPSPYLPDRQSAPAFLRAGGSASSERKGSASSERKHAMIILTSSMTSSMNTRPPHRKRRRRRPVRRTSWLVTLLRRIGRKPSESR